MSVYGKDIDEVAKRAQENANLIWNAANSLFGAFKPHEYGLVILPMCVIKRFHDCLLPKHDAVLAAYEQHKDKGARAAAFLRAASGYHFYNTSKFTFAKLKADPENIDDNFQDFLNGFSEDVQEILNRMNFAAQIERMKEAKCLYQVICDFSVEKLDMSEGKISTVDMGYIFENLVQRFSESYDEEAGAHFTSRDIIYLMCDLLTSKDKRIEDKDFHCTVYDMTMGTSQMLTCMTERILEKAPNADVQTFGQEINPFTMGVAVADTLIHGGDPDNMQFGDTLSDDKFDGYHFDYVISNPPFGIDWKREATEVEKEHKRGDEGRFAPGLPGKGDGQMLFLLNGIAKLKENGRMAIIQNGSSLFTGDAESGQSEIRRFIIENDWLDAIVELPADSFYNTGISTYVWIIDKNKPNTNPGRVQLIDASACCQNRRKNIGNKKVDITDKCREIVVEAYKNYVSGDYEQEIEDGNTVVCKSKVIESQELGYRKIVIETPKYNDDGTMALKSGKKVADVAERDTDNVPFSEDINDYFEREVLPYSPDSWIDEKKTKIGYEIQFTRYFYECETVEPSVDIAKRIEEREKALISKLQALFGEVH